MHRFERAIRKLIPSTPILSRSSWFYPLSRGIDLTVGAAARHLIGGIIPPVRYIVRTGTNKNIITPQIRFMLQGYNYWLHKFADGTADLNSSIVDIGCGCGKLAAALRDYDFHGDRFRGHYYGFDADREMIEWCQRYFPPNHFTFVHVNPKSSVYNPGGSVLQVKLEPCRDSSVDLAISNSLFSHLLAEDVKNYLKESFRVLRPGGKIFMTFFCIDDMRTLGLLGGRWTFDHRIGSAYVENIHYPEAAVGVR
jgi:SAM-dependent methyltransferase